MPCACRAWLRVGVLDGPTVTHGSPIPTSSIFPSYIFNITGGWFQSTPLKNDGVKVSWLTALAFRRRGRHHRNVTTETGETRHGGTSEGPRIG